MMEMTDEKRQAVEEFVEANDLRSLLMSAALRDGDWPYVAGLIMMAKSYKELSGCAPGMPNALQKFIMETCAKYGEDFPHDEWMEAGQRENLRTTAKAVREYNKLKDRVAS